MKNIVTVMFVMLLACMLFSGCETAPPSSTSGQSFFSISEGPPGSSRAEAVSEGAESESLDAAEESVPLYADQITDGIYAVEVSSSSSMFRIVNAQLTVEGSAMKAVLTLSGTGYEKLYMGTGEEALTDTDDKCIYFVENAEGQFTYEIPVPALNRDVNVAAWSIRKEKWYDRVLVFRFPAPDGESTAPAAADAEPPSNGRYTVEVALSGGSGKASIQSPTDITITEGAAVAVVTWSSSHYEHMRIGNDYYYPTRTDGGAVFEIPVTLDLEMAVSAQTTSMSTPHEIDYILSFDSGTLKPVQ